MEQQNNISISLFVYEDKTPYRIYTSKQILKSMWIYYYNRILKAPIMF